MHRSQCLHVRLFATTPQSPSTPSVVSSTAASVTAAASSMASSAASVAASTASVAKSTARTFAAAAAAAMKSSIPAAADTANIPAVPTLESVRTEALWVYRTTLRHIRALPSASAREDSLAEARRTFRAAARENPTDAAAALLSQQKALTSAYSRLSFLRMSTPKLLQPRMDIVPAYPQARALFGAGISALATSSAGGETKFMYVDGEVMPVGERTGAGTRISNSQGLTDEQFRRHHALVERMNFRGPFWEGKPKY